VATTGYAREPIAEKRRAYRGTGEWPYAVRQNSAAAPKLPPGSTAAATEVAKIFSLAGIEIGGRNPWDLQVYDERFYRRLLSDGSLASGESYMDGWWDAEALDELCTRVHGANLPDKVGKWKILCLALISQVFNRQTKSKSTDVSQKHYDLGNDIYEAMLDRRMQYTCGYWKDATTLDQAQENKLRLICRKIQLEPGMTVLDLGAGFGGLAHFMASEYGCRVVSYNISAEQLAYGREWCRNLPIRFEHKDYREAAHEAEAFDRVISIGLCEHIGLKNYPAFFELAHSKLKSGGLFLLHSIGGNASYTCTDPWMDKYIFPNGMVPSVAQLGKAMEGLWVVEDWHNFGPDYDKTLMAWWHNFDRAWPALQQKYGERFYRMWKYYLMGCAGAFRARKLQLWQIVLSKGDIPAYMPVR
jgi:cyclopropane-fatty-acyl-phospholipid synthase